MSQRIKNIRAFGPRLMRRFKDLVGDARGVAAVEFAMLLPLMMTLYLGVVEVSQGIAIARKVTLTTRTLSDLASRVGTINNSAMTNILNASAAVLAPYPVANLKVWLTAVKIDLNKNATVAWGDALNATKKSGSVTLDPALAVADTMLIMSEAEYAYKPTIGYVVTGTLTLKDKMYMRPRLGKEVTRDPT